MTNDQEDRMVKALEKIASGIHGVAALLTVIGVVLALTCVKMWPLIPYVNDWLILSMGGK